jgi:hypothetical protein
MYRIGAETTLVPDYWSAGNGAIGGNKALDGLYELLPSVEGGNA